MLKFRKLRIPMADNTNRSLAERVKHHLCERATENGNLTENEACHLADRLVGDARLPKELGRAIHARFAVLGGIELELSERGPMRPLPKFG